MEPDERKLIDLACGEAIAAGSTDDGLSFDTVRWTPPDGCFDGYDVIREIHRGGQGIVFQARQQSTERDVAIKVMKHGPLASDSEQARFRREIRILAQLEHPNIVTIHDSGIADGLSYFVMDHIAGAELDKYIANRRHSIHEKLRLLGKICTAINEAHLHGIVHRDLKPGNIRVGRDDEPKVLDFGLAKQTDDSGEASMQTATGQFVGSLPWSSPEQMSHYSIPIDIRTDVYSLGVIGYQMLTGKFPYEVVGPIQCVMSNIANADPVRPRAIKSEIDDEAETILLKCLSKEPERRYQSAGELARDLERYLAGEPIEAKRNSYGYLVRKTLRRFRVQFILAATFLFAGLLVGATVTYSATQNAVVAIADAVEAKRQAKEAQSKLESLLAERMSKQGENVVLHDDYAREVFNLSGNEASARAYFRFDLGTHGTVQDYRDCDFHFHDRRISVDEPSLIWDLGPVGTDWDRPIAHGSTLLAKSGNVYIMHIKDSDSSLWARFDVLECIKDTRLVFRWEIISRRDDVDVLTFTKDILQQRRIARKGGNLEVILDLDYAKEMLATDGTPNSGDSKRSYVQAANRFSFQHDDPEKLLFGNQFDIRFYDSDIEVENYESKIWDIGPIGFSFSELRCDDFEASFTKSNRAQGGAGHRRLPAVKGHVYIIHSRNVYSDYWTKLKVLECIDNSRLVFCWELLDRRDTANVELFKFADQSLSPTAVPTVIENGTARIQIRSGGEYDDCRGYLDCVTWAVNEVADQPLDLDLPLRRDPNGRVVIASERPTAWCDGGVIPAGKVWLIEEIDFRADVEELSQIASARGGFGLTIGHQELLRVDGFRDGYFDMSTLFGKERRKFSKVLHLKKKFRGRTIIPSGKEASVFVETLGPASCVDVRLKGRFVDKNAPAIEGLRYGRWEMADGAKLNLETRTLLKGLEENPVNLNELVGNAKEFSSLFRRRVEGPTIELGTFDQEQTMPDGATLKIPAGVHTLNTELYRRYQFPRHILVVGEGINETLLHLDEPIWTGHGTVNLTFRDMTIHCGGNTLHSGQKAAIRMERCRVVGFHVMFGSAGAFYASDCRFEAGFDTGFAGLFTPGPSRDRLLVRLENSLLEGPIGVFPTTPKAAYHFEGCEIRDTESMLSTCITRVSDGLTFADCTKTTLTMRPGDLPDHGWRKLSEINPAWPKTLKDVKVRGPNDGLDGGAGANAFGGSMRVPVTNYKARVIAAEKPEAVVIPKRENRPYGRSAYSFRFATQDSDIHRNAVDLSYGSCGLLHISFHGGQANRIVDVGDTPIDIGNRLPTEALFPPNAFQTCIKPVEGHYYVQKVSTGGHEMIVQFQLIEVTDDKVELRWWHQAGGAVARTSQTRGNSRRIWILCRSTRRALIVLRIYIRFGFIKSSSSAVVELPGLSEPARATAKPYGQPTTSNRCSGQG